MRAIERAALALLPHLEQPRDDGQAAARAAILAFLDGTESTVAKALADVEDGEAPYFVTEARAVLAALRAQAGETE